MTDSARSGLRPIPLTRPPSSWFVRLCVKSGRFVTSGQSSLSKFLIYATRCRRKVCSSMLKSARALLPYRRERFTPVLGNTSPASGGEIGQRFPAHPPQRHPGAFLVGPARHLVQRAPREAAFDAGVANLDRLVGDPGGNQHARQFVGCSVARPGRIAPAINLALGLENARPFRRPGVFERPLPHGDQRPSPRRLSRRR